MKKVLNLIEEKVVAAFESAGIDKKYARVALSNRPIYVNIKVMERCLLLRNTKKLQL